MAELVNNTHTYNSSSEMTATMPDKREKVEMEPHLMALNFLVHLKGSIEQ